MVVDPTVKWSAYERALGWTRGGWSAWMESHMQKLRNRDTIARKVCNWLFSLRWESRQCAVQWERNRMGMTLWSLKMYKSNCSKTKSYQIQSKYCPLFVFLFIRLRQRAKPSSHAIKPSLPRVSRPIFRFYSLGYAIKFCLNPNAKSATLPKSRI